AVLGQPWLPGQIGAALNGQAVPQTPSLETQHNVVLELYRDELDHHMERVGVRHARKHLAAALDVAEATAGQPLSAEIRRRVLTSEVAAHVFSALNEAYDDLQWRAAA
ncbi:MAG: tRNA dihydrouridine synthase DusB, partial [Alphaproteobacteria bacterium]